MRPGFAIANQVFEDRRSLSSDSKFSFFSTIGSPLSSSSLSSESHHAPSPVMSEVPPSPSRRLVFDRDDCEEEEEDFGIVRCKEDYMSGTADVISLCESPVAQRAMKKKNQFGFDPVSSELLMNQETCSSSDFGSSSSACGMACSYDTSGASAESSSIISESQMMEDEPYAIRFPRSFSVELTDGDRLEHHQPPCKVSAVDPFMRSTPTSPFLGELPRPSGDTLSDSFERSQELAMLPANNRSNTLLPTIVGAGRSDYPYVSVDTVADLLNGKLSIPTGYRLLIIDCRFPFEYGGGHIRGAENVIVPNVRNKLKDLLYPMDMPFKAVLLFHCEFSHNRGPSVMKILREMDRGRNVSRYPMIDYDQMYLIHGGYKAFHKKYPELCDPVGCYVPMDHPSFSATLTECNSSFKQECSRERLPSLLQHRSCSEMLTHTTSLRRTSSLMSSWSLSMSDLSQSTPLKHVVSRARTPDADGCGEDNNKENNSK